MITTLLQTLPARAQRQVAKSLIGSLNSSIIGNIRGHIRTDALEQVADHDAPPDIDLFNEAMAAIAESRATNDAFEATGMTTQMSSIEVAQRQNIIREYLVDFLMQNKGSAYDTPLSIGDTLEFQLKNAPSANEERLRALSKAVNIDFEQLKTVQIAAFQREREQLAKVAGHVLTIAASLDNGFISTTTEAGEQIEYSFTGTAEDAFDTLPAHVRFKLVASSIRALKKADDDAIMQLLRFNNMDGAADHALIEAVKASCVQWLVKFQETNAHELDAYLERGGQLPDIDQPPALKPEAILAA